jgi:hypothetical protein
MKSPVTRYDEELLANAQRLVVGLEENGALAKALGAYDLDAKALDRGRFLVDETRRSFEWEREGKAYNYLSATPEGRMKEARYWNKDAHRRHRQACFRDAEAVIGKRGIAGIFSAWSHLARALSPALSRALRRELLAEVERAREGKPSDAPLPKDTALVQLSGWYERWSLAALTVLREKPDELARVGIAAGKAAPRRLRNKNDARGHASAQRHLDVVTRPSR